jgi:ferredoxin
MFSLTTQHASGHNPRPTGKERFRQRFMHKLKYFQDDFDVMMCVGCGRCVQSCPVNIDIRELIQALTA